MRIVYVSFSRIPSRSANSIQVMKMCQAFVQEGNEVSLVAPQGYGDHSVRDDIWSHYGVLDRFPICYVRARKAIRGYDYAVSAVLVAKRRKVDVIYTRHLQTAFLAGLLNIPCILELHSTITGRLGPTLFRIYLRLSRSHRVIAIPEALCRLLALEYAALTRDVQCLIAPDGVDLARFEKLVDCSDARAQVGLKDAFTVMYSGSLQPHRGIELLLDLAERFSDVQFVFVGGDPASRTRRESEARMRVLSNVRFLGFVANRDLPKYLAAAEVLAMPYERSVFSAQFMSPMKMFEYMAAGRAIIASDLPVLREVLSDDIAVLCSPGDIDSWGCALSRLTREEAYRRELSANARCAAEQYEWRQRVDVVLRSGCGKQELLSVVAEDRE